MRNRNKHFVVLLSYLLILIIFVGCSDKTSGGQSNIAQKIPEKVYVNDLLGYSMCFYTDTKEDLLTIREYFYEGKDGSCSKIAESWNVGVEDYEQDIDGDGITELICNCMSAVDGHKEVYVYRNNKGVVELGYVDWLSHGLSDLYYWGINAVQTEYNYENGKIEVRYCSKEMPESGSVAIQVGFDWLSFSKWEGENTSFIDIEKAYELYERK